MGTSSVQAQAIHLAFPHGDLIMDGSKTLIVKTHQFDLAGRQFWLAQEGHVYGRVRVGDAVKVESVAKLNALQEQHRITPQERQSWWGESKVFWTWPVEVVDKWDRPKPYERAGVQTFISDVVLKDGSEDVVLIPTDQDDGLAAGEMITVDSVGMGGDLAKYVGALLTGANERLYAGMHHDGQGPLPYGGMASIEKSEAGDTVEPSSMPPDESMYQAFVAAGALEPPLPPDFFIEVFRQSNILRQCLDVYATNVDGFSHHFDPVLDLDSDDSWRLVRSLLEAELPDGSTLPSEEEGKEGTVEARLERYRQEAALEQARLGAFFDWAGLGQSFVQLRKITRFDRELIGYGGWEVLRNAKGEISKFVHVPAYTIRLMPADPRPTKIVEKQRHGAPWETKDVPVWRYFRRFVHWQGGGQTSGWTGGGRYSGTIVYFRDFLDPRTVSRKTGRYYPNPQAMRADEGEDAQAANEMIYFVDGTLDTPYGEPRWIGNLLSVLGSRSAEEVNFLFFQNKSIPPLVLMISGGGVTPEDVEALKTRIRDELQGGPDKHHKILIVTAKTDQATGQQPTLEFKPLTEALMKEALFLEYDKANRFKVAQSMRIPPILIGDTKDFNRATANAALRFAETQVFSGLRSDFDWLINHLILSALGAQYWKFVSNPPPLTDPNDVVKNVALLAKDGIITPAEGRRELARVGFSLDKIEEAWTKRPLAVTFSGVGFEPEEGERITQSKDTMIHDPESPDPMTAEDAMQHMEAVMEEAVREGNLSPEILQRLNLQNVRRRLLAHFQDPDATIPAAQEEAEEQ